MDAEARQSHLMVQTKAGPAHIAGNSEVRRTCETHSFFRVSVKLGFGIIPSAASRSLPIHPVAHGLFVGGPCFRINIDDKPQFCMFGSWSVKMLVRSFEIEV